MGYDALGSDNNIYKSRNLIGPVGQFPNTFYSLIYKSRNLIGPVGVDENEFVARSTKVEI